MGEGREGGEGIMGELGWVRQVAEGGMMGRYVERAITGRGNVCLVET